MKKFKHLLTILVTLSYIYSCTDKTGKWTEGLDRSGKTHDTAILKKGSYHYFRYFGTGWYPLGRNNRINTIMYQPSSMSDIADPSFAPRAASGIIRSGALDALDDDTGR